MFGRKKPATEGRSGRGNDLLAQMGMGGAGMDVDLSGMGIMVPPDDDDNDEDLEAELLALQSGQPIPQRPARRSKPKPATNRQAGITDLDKLYAMDDIDNEDIDVDENDPELTAELMGLVTDEQPPPAPKQRAHAPPPPAPSQMKMTSVLRDRISMYDEAIKNAQENNDSSKLRRYTRQIKTLKDLLKQAEAGKAVAEDEIPPVVHTKISPSSEQPPVSQSETRTVSKPAIPDTQRPKPASPGAVSTSQSEHELLCTRRDGYKRAALDAKHRGDMDAAKRFFVTAKQFDAVIAASEAGNPVDLSQMPPPAPVPGQQAPAPSTRQKAPAPPQQAQPAPASNPAPTSTLEALQQRLAKYKETGDQARQAGNASKARRNDRIVKQYEDAIKLHKAGKPVAFDELPTPPGFEPFPTGGPPSVTATSPRPSAPGTPPVDKTDSSQPAPKPQPRAKQPAPAKSTAPAKPMGKNQETLMFLAERQKQYKLEALKAKKAGNLDKAREYLRTAKGFEPMIQSLQNGLPVDMSQVPPAPGEEEKLNSGSYEFVEPGDCTEPAGDREDMYKNLEQQLINQIRLCTDNAHHFAQLGDISSAKTFEKYGENCRKDLDSVKNAYQHGDPVPRFHYETKEFKIVQSCTDLGDNDVDINVIRGVNYNPPSGYSADDLDTYVHFEFPFPADEHQEGKTETVRNSVSPEYDSSTKLQINRKSRALLRVVKMKALKLEVYYKRGFLKSDKVLGTASIKLAPLEQKCVVHESVDLLEGRRPCGGRLEVKIRIREPLTGKQVETNREKWLVIDQFQRNSPAKKTAVIKKNERRSDQTAEKSKICSLD